MGGICDFRSQETKDGQEVKFDQEVTNENRVDYKHSELNDKEKVFVNPSFAKEHSNNLSKLEDGDNHGNYITFQNNVNKEREKEQTHDNEQERRNDLNDRVENKLDESSEFEQHAEVKTDLNKKKKPEFFSVAHGLKKNQQNILLGFGKNILNNQAIMA